MIIDKLSNAYRYYSVHPSFRAAFEQLAALDTQSENKRYTVDEDKIFVNLSEYENKPVGECKFESHARYIDIQYVLSGHEWIDVTDTEGLSFTENNLENGDIAFYQTPCSYTTADLSDGWFVILFPGEAHRPLVAPNGTPVKTKKAVAKILEK